MATMARNMAIDHIRKNRREILESFTKDDEESVIIEPVSDEDIQDAVTEDIGIKEAISKLKPDEQQVVNMKVLAEMTFSEISQELGVPMGTITWRYREAMVITLILIL